MQLTTTPTSQPDSLPSEIGMIRIGESTFPYLFPCNFRPTIRQGPFVIIKNPLLFAFYHFLSRSRGWYSNFTVFLGSLRWHPRRIADSQQYFSRACRPFVASSYGEVEPAPATRPASFDYPTDGRLGYPPPTPTTPVFVVLPVSSCSCAESFGKQ